MTLQAIQMSDPAGGKDDLEARPTPLGVDPDTWARVAGYPVFSFDIFETLIHRHGMFRPIDLFPEFARRAGPDWDLSPGEFARLRIQAERDARSAMIRRPGQEVLLSEIYSHLNALLPSRGHPMLSREELKQLQEIEMAVELEYLQAIPSVAALYKAAIEAGKRIVLISDFYAPRSFIEQALHNAGFDGYEALFVSSEIGLTKHHADLYPYVCTAMDISACDIVHFGDNPWSDGSCALQSGIAHFRIRNPVNPLTARLRLDWTTPAEPLPSTLHASLSETLYGVGTEPREPADTAVPERVGREALGPLLLGMASWLHAELREHPLPHLHFCSRDGLVMKRAFDLYQARHGALTETRYLKVSRQVIYRARAAQETDTIRALFTQNWARLTPAAALHRWGLDPARFETEIRAAGFASDNVEIAIGDRAGKACFEALFDSCHEALRAQNAEHAALFHAYLAQENLLDADRAMIVDIGWHGSLQKGIAGILAADGWTGHLSGRYLGLFLSPKDLANFDARGYLFSLDDTPRTRALRASPSLVELLHTAGHGSTAGYTRTKSGEIKALLEARSDEERQHAVVIAPIQSAALAFVEEILSNPRLGPDVLHPADAFRGLDRLLNRPDPDEVEFLGRLRIAANYGATASSVALTERSAEGYRLWNTEPG